MCPGASRHGSTSLCGMWLTGNTSAWLTVSLFSVSVPAPRDGRLHVSLVQLPLTACTAPPRSGNDLSTHPSLTLSRTTRVPNQSGLLGAQTHVTCGARLVVEHSTCASGPVFLGFEKCPTS